MNHVNQSPSRTIAADRPASTRHDELMARTTGPSKIVLVQDHDMTFNEIRIECIISIDIAILVRSQHRQRLFESNKPKPHAKTLDENREHECFVQEILVQRQLVHTLQYQVRWRGYKSKDDTFEPPYKIQHHFIVLY